MTIETPSARLRRLLEELQAVSDPAREPINASPKLAALKIWQGARLGRTFSSLRANERYGPATEFFLSDLYGAGDVTWRDRDIGRIMPVITHALPDSVLYPLSEALELDLISRHFDLEMARVMEETALDVSRYAAAYRQVGDPANRQRQINLIRSVGEELEFIVLKPFVLGVLKLARGPARSVGLATLQEFLERGFAAWRHMGPAREFLDTIVDSEEQAMQRMFAAHPDPFGFELSRP
jgi:hypothetical protein